VKLGGAGLIEGGIKLGRERFQNLVKEESRVGSLLRYSSGGRGSSLLL